MADVTALAPRPDLRLLLLPADQRALNTYADDYINRAGRTEVSRRTLEAALRVVAEKLCRFWRNASGKLVRPFALNEIPWAKVTPQLAAHAAAELAEMRTKQGKLVSAATTNLRLAALRQVLIRAGVMSEQMRAALPRQAGNSVPAKGLELGDVAALMRAAGEGRKGLRDRALVALLFGAGLRRAEASGLDLEHLQDGTLRVYGKGRKWRRIPMPPGALRAVEAWVKERGHDAGPLLQRLDRSGAMLGRLSTNGIYDVVRGLGRAAGVGKIHPHMGRAYMVGTMLDVGDVTAAQAQCGHVDPKQTSLYNRRGWRQLANTVERVYFPAE